MRRKTLSDAGVADLKSKAARYTFPDPELRGHYVRVMPSGAKSFVAVSRDPNGKQVWATIGAADMMGVEKAREDAREAIKRIRAGLPAIEQKKATETFKDVSDAYLKRHVAAKGLLSEKEIKRCVDVYVSPRWEKREFIGIRRGDVATLLDEIEDSNGARQADMVLAIVRGICNWYAARNEDYLSPIVRGMRRASPVKRERVLSDDEIRAVWQQAGKAGTFGDILRLALSTGQRRDKVMTIRWDDVSVDGVWNVSSDDREKGTGGELKLPALALDVIRSRSRVGESPYVFTGRTKDGYFNGMSKAKVEFDKKVPIDHWTIHDLRRTGRSLMARAGVSSDTAERVMGHAIEGVQGVYNRHRYGAEKADALARLDALLKTILNPPAKNVVPIKQRARK
ncbi:integrase family protein [Mesorhizobium sp. BR115XR7A]|uniref:tyrosine-type recombinase/integrase n=1 Tax=Mesorhizobium sp. BR115XR7A TaxID=2876645 RepID=UPI001CC9CA32|nr:integrase family protein [Mesorhizobium sp. BR115XR7A]MBZ9910128.1 integrase family protein [Mesorhizobium sp. BR115XR7A]MBZ9933885.1 integrase family protein [Mesorhizobium sp. BR1-1-5]